MLLITSFRCFAFGFPLILRAGCSLFSPFRALSEYHFYKSTAGLKLHMQTIEMTFSGVNLQHRIKLFTS
jgi:hypothetical protein